MGGIERRKPLKPVFPALQPDMARHASSRKQQRPKRHE